MFKVRSKSEKPDCHLKYGSQPTTNQAPTPVLLVDLPMIGQPRVLEWIETKSCKKRVQLWYKDVYKSDASSTHEE